MMQVVTGSSESYHINPIGLQPGDATHLPWLSRLANNYETYHVVSMTARYVPTCPTTTAGRVLFYWEYDVNDAPATDYKSASAQWHAVATPPWKGVTIPLDVKKVHAQIPQKRVTPFFANDFRSDIAIFNVCRTAGTVGAWGEVWLDFVFDFKTPTYNTSGDVEPIPPGATTRYEISGTRTLPSSNNVYHIPLDTEALEPVIDECNLGNLSAPTGAIESTSSSGVAGGGCVLLPPGSWGIEAVFDTSGPYVAHPAADRISQYTTINVSTDPTDVRSTPDAILDTSYEDLPIAINTVASSNTRRNYIYSTFSSDVATYVALAAKIQGTLSAARTIYDNAVLAFTWLGSKRRPYTQLVALKANKTFEHYRSTGNLALFGVKVTPHLPLEHPLQRVDLRSAASESKTETLPSVPPPLERMPSEKPPLPSHRPLSRSSSPLRVLSPAPYRSV